MSDNYPFHTGLSIIIVAFLISLTGAISCSAQDTSEQSGLFKTYINTPGKTESKMEELLLLAEKDRDNGFKLKALEKIQIALILEKDLSQPSYIAFKLNSFIAKFTGPIDLRYCLEFYRKAATLERQLTEVIPPERFVLYTDRAGAHALLMEYDSAVYYYNVAMKAAVLDSRTSVASTYNNLGVFYHKIEQYDSAEVYFQKALNALPHGKGDVGLYSAIRDNLAQLDIRHKKYASALKTFQFNDSVYLARGVENKYLINKVRLLEMMEKLNLPGIEDEINTLQVYADKHQIAIPPKEILKFYLFAADYFFSRKKYNLSKEFRVKYNQGADSLHQATVDQLHLLTQSMLKVEENSFKNELKTHQLTAEKAQLKLRSAQRIILLSVISMGIIITLLILYFRKRRQELYAQTQIAESELKNKVMEAKLMQQELILKKRDLTNVVLHNTHVHDANLKLIDRLYGISRQKENMDQEIRSLLIDLQNQNQAIDRSAIIQSNIDSVNEEFYENLKNRFPYLTKAESELCGYIRINLTTKDISILKHVEAASVKMSKNRLRKKLGITAEEDIYDFVKRL